MKLVRLAALCSVLVLSACGVPRHDQTESALFIQQAETAFTQNDIQAAGAKVDAASVMQAGAARVKEFFASHPDWLARYGAYLNNAVEIQSTAAAAQRRRENLTVLRAVQLYPDAEIDRLEKRFGETLLAAQQNGTLKLVLGDQIATHPMLQPLPIQQDIFAATVLQIKRNPSSIRPLAELSAYASRPDIPAYDRKLAEESLWRLNLKRRELPLVADAMRNFTVAREKQLTTHIALNVQSNSVFSRDIVSAVGEGHGILWHSNGPGSPVVSVKEVRYSRSDKPQESQIISYGGGDIDNSVPSDAVFSYQASSQQNSLDFAYDIRATINGILVHQEQVSGIATSYQRSCHNNQLWIPGYGAQAAGFIANADMSRRCSNDESLESMFARHVPGQIAAAILRVPQVRAIAALQ
ncbi:hypothetical protein FXN63_05480 [Pigmentiphaga aceris]|uniref:Uncharacterized protein n=1 Tax=Pigmentiphaga aceris TaxID=1940612 RepID=A0A5C0AVH4_9BURK|nr:hypothetical protein [Pigmentiphaga aceris]QEI05353.1 hypothetical protein FXN63_05480 [Pigmentiphaga aceris]